MKIRILGKDLKVSTVGLGRMGFTHAYGTAMDETEAANTIAQAVEMGYSFFDTAECYIGERKDGATAFNEDLVGCRPEALPQGCSYCHEVRCASQ